MNRDQGTMRENQRNRGASAPAGGANRLVEEVGERGRGTVALCGVIALSASVWTGCDTGTEAEDIAQTATVEEPLSPQGAEKTIPLRFVFMLKCDSASTGWKERYPGVLGSIQIIDKIYASVRT